MGVLHAKTPGIRTRHPTEADEKPVDAARCRVYRAIVGKAQWILRALPDVFAPLRTSTGGCREREVDFVAAKRMVKYFYGTRDIAFEHGPRMGPLRLDSASDSDLAGLPNAPREPRCG